MTVVAPRQQDPAYNRLPCTFLSHNGAALRAAPKPSGFAGRTILRDIRGTA